MALSFLRHRSPVAHCALVQFKKTIALDPNYVGVYVYLGYAYESRKLLPEAIAAFQKAMSLAGERWQDKHSWRRHS